MQNKEFTKAFANAVGLPALFPVPPLMLQIVFGEMSSIILDSQIVRPDKLKELGFSFNYANIDKAMLEIFNQKKIQDVEYKGLESFDDYVFIPKPKNDVFTFFSDPRNLKKITPQDINFAMKSMSTDEIQEGTEINYKLSKYGLPLSWKSLITVWKPQEKFVDIQLKGPYSVWHHTHAFYEIEGGTIIHDKVLFKLPLGPLGYIVSLFLVRSDIKNIFSFRKKTISTIFS